MSTQLRVVDHLLLTQILLGLVAKKQTVLYSYILVTDSLGQDETPYIIQKTANSALGLAYRVENLSSDSR